MYKVSKRIHHKAIKNKEFSKIIIQFIITIRYFWVLLFVWSSKKFVFANLLGSFFERKKSCKFF